jgi:hypothetical protein
MTVKWQLHEISFMFFFFGLGAMVNGLLEDIKYLEWIVQGLTNFCSTASVIRTN